MRKLTCALTALLISCGPNLQIKEGPGCTEEEDTTETEEPETSSPEDTTETETSSEDTTSENDDTSEDSGTTETDSSADEGVYHYGPCSPQDVCEGGTCYCIRVGSICSVPCSQDDDCPDVPSGNPLTTCIDNRCILDCSNNRICPDGMECVPELDWCLWRHP